MKILIVEDDTMVQLIHKRYLERLGYADILTATTPAAARQQLQATSVDLVLLDIHLQNENGLTLLREWRQAYQPFEVILITAANEVHYVKESVQLGIVDYLIKPFTFERFAKSIQLAADRQLPTTTLTQTDLDQFLHTETPSATPTLALEKGLTQETLQLVYQASQTLGQPFTIQALAAASGLSHVSVRKYVLFLEQRQLLTSEKVHVKVGRPYQVYHLLDNLDEANLLLDRKEPEK